MVFVYYINKTALYDAIEKNNLKLASILLQKPEIDLTTRTI